MGSVREDPWKLEFHEKFRLPWYAIFLFFIDHKSFKKFVKKANQINRGREEDKRKEFLKTRPKRRLTPQGRRLPQNDSRVPMPPVNQPKSSLQNRHDEFFPVKNERPKNYTHYTSDTGPR